MANLPSKQLLRYPDFSKLERKLKIKNNKVDLSSFLGDLYAGIMYQTEQGQILSSSARNSTIVLDTTGVELVDFSSPKLDRMRGKEKLADLKDDLINEARKIVNESIF